MRRHSSAAHPSDRRILPAFVVFALAITACGVMGPAMPSQDIAAHSACCSAEWTLTISQPAWIGLPAGVAIWSLIVLMTASRPAGVLSPLIPSPIGFLALPLRR